MSWATVGEIARRAGVPVHRVVYVVNSRRIAAVRRAGVARVFSEANVEFVLSELRRIEAERSAGCHARLRAAMPAIDRPKDFLKSTTG
jgi:hypothetical protein